MGLAVVKERLGKGIGRVQEVAPPTGEEGKLDLDEGKELRIHKAEVS